MDKRKAGKAENDSSAPVVQIAKVLRPRYEVAISSLAQLDAAV